MFPELHPEGQHQIQDNRRAKSQERSVYEVKANAAGRKMQLLTNPGTYPENLVL